MQWTVQVIVVLLNIAWIVFFLQPDPFSVSVQRRSSDSSDEEMLFRQFCIQPHPDMNWTSTVHSANITSNKTNSTNTTAEECAPRNLTLHGNSNLTNCQCNETNIQPQDFNMSQLSEIALRAPAPGCQPQIIIIFADKEVCIDVSSFLSAITPLIRFETTSARPSPVPGLSFTGCCIKFYSIRLRKDLIRSYYRTDTRCSKTAVVFVTVKSRHICVDPELSWVQSIMKSLDKGSS